MSLRPLLLLPLALPTLSQLASSQCVRWAPGFEYPGGHGLDAPVRALAFHDDGSGPALYAGGQFTNAGSVTAPGVARFDGSGWSSLGTGIAGTVRALCTFDDGSGPAL